jgi:hypothetical protein
MAVSFNLCLTHLGRPPSNITSCCSARWCWTTRQHRAVDSTRHRTILAIPPPPWTRAPSISYASAQGHKYEACPPAMQAQTLRTHKHTHTHTHTHTRIRHTLLPCKHKRTNTQTNKQTHTHTHTHTRARARTHTHTHTHTHFSLSPWRTSNLPHLTPHLGHIHTHALHLTPPTVHIHSRNHLPNPWCRLQTLSQGHKQPTV